MKEEEIMDELYGLDGSLKSFPPDAHWFCPKRNNEDSVDYSNPDEAEDDISAAKISELIEESKKRHHIAYKYSVVLGLGPEQAGCMLEDWVRKVNRLLRTCDKCVHNYHFGRRAHIKELSEQFNDEIVAELSKRLNEFDFQRINFGLELGHRMLSTVEPQRRTSAYLASNEMSALMALFEALCCVDFHKNVDLLAVNFDYVFTNVQSKKVLRMSDILPAMARFLFSRDEVRRRFGHVSWEKMGGSLTAKQFEWVVHDVLTETVILVSQPNADPIDIQNFWAGFLLILQRMDEVLITHSLCGMEVQPNIYHLALQHLHCGSDVIIRLIIQSIHLLLQRAPRSFWSTMGTISPFTVAELVFKSPGFAQMLMDPSTFEDGHNSIALSWIPDFLASLSSIQQYEACRAMCLYLFSRLQDSKYPERSRTACLYAGLNSLHTILQTFVDPDYQINTSTSLIVIDDIMGLVDTHKLTITGCADLSDNENLRDMSRLAIRSVLTLDCKAVGAEYTALVAGSAVQRGSRIHSQGIWQAVLNIFWPGSIDLAKHILPATILLTGIDELWPEDKKRPERLPKDHIQFNKDFHELMDNIARIFERLSDFSSMDLNQLPMQPITARPLFAALISMDQGVYEAAVEVIKAMTGQSGRQDAVWSLLDTAFVPLLRSLSTAVLKVAISKTFGSTPNIIKIGREILKSLCGSTGILRAHHKLEAPERKAVLAWWVSQWKALDVVFSCTELWGMRVIKQTSEMTEYLRDCMEYAEALFNEHSIFAAAMIAPVPSPGNDAEERGTTSRESLTQVLQIICQNINGFVGMLRLRDSYLISVAVNLLVQLLRCLGEFNLEVQEYASKFIQDACKDENRVGYRRTNLNNQQKAELRRALDDHQGIEIIEEPKSIVKKQITIDAWSNSADVKQHESKLPAKVSRFPIDSNIDQKRNILAEMKARTNTVAREAVSQIGAEAFRERRRLAEEESRRSRAEAIARAKALRAPSGVKGEGSGIKDIGGITGKDHAPKRSELLFGSSDESDEDEDEDEDETNALVKTLKVRNQKISEYEENRRRNMRLPQGPVKKTKVQRSAKDLRARVEPNMDKLYLEILNWDLFHSGDNPPSNNFCRKIDDKYLDLDLYKTTFGPLLISEVWKSLTTAKDENNYKPVEIKILNRLAVDKFIEVSTSMPIAYNKDIKMSERDIVLLSRSSDPMNNQKEPNCLARIDRITRKKDVLEITYRVSREIKTPLLQCLVPNAKIYAVKIADMTTTQREYAALSSLEYYDLCSEILEAKPSPLQIYSEERVNSMGAKYQLNKGQAKAIMSANENDGFTLIQGPPGSGKTKTIVAMVGSLMTQTLQQQAAEIRMAKPSTQVSPQVPSPKKKLLICAPSNAAVDELVLRLMDGVQPLNGPFQKINVIRIGRSDAINASVKEVMLDELVRLKLEGDDGENKLINDRDQLHKDAAAIKERLNILHPLMQEAHKSGENLKAQNIQREIDTLKRSQASIGAKIDEDKARGNTVSRQNEINRRRFQQEIIDGAHVLCSTLSGSGHDMFRNLNVEFETVIIDEAAQCIELSALIPLKYGCSKCILVGDPEQLPPTVLSRSAASFGYEQSLFVRMQRNFPKDVHLLDTQYRMHPEISVFPSWQFYGGRLIDGDNMARLRDQPWHASTILGPYRFFDVKGAQTHEDRGHSLINVPELNAAIALYERLKSDFREYDFKGKIGIITTYKAQLVQLKIRFERRFGEAVFDEIEFNTTDAFQGREREIIIFSCVRAKTTGGIGFLGDIRRMNVGLTRAKSSLWVLGDSSALQQGEYWNKLIQDSKERDRYTGGDIMNILKHPTTRDRQGLREAQIMMKSSWNRERQSPAHDVEMVDVPSNSSSTSRKLSASESSSGSSGVPKESTQKLAGQRTRGLAGLGIVADHRRPYSVAEGTAVAFAAEALGKRQRESSDEGDSKRAITPKMEILSDAKKERASELDIALAASEAAKAAAQAAAPSRPVRPLGVPPPRRRAPADPFIKKRPPPARR